MVKKAFLLILLLCGRVCGETSEFEFLNNYYSPALISSAGYCNLYSLSPSAGLYNPALYSKEQNSSIEANFNTSHQLLKKYSIAAKHTAKNFAIGGGIIFLSTQPIEEIAYDGTRTGNKINYSEYGFILGLAKSIYSIETGINLKLAGKNIMCYSSKGVGMDVGLLIPVKQISFGIGLQNISFSKDKNLPTILKLDCDLNLNISKHFRINTGIGIQNLMYNSYEPEGGIGMELDFYKMFLLRSGMNLQDHDIHFSFGAGLKISGSKSFSIMIDYSFKPNLYLGAENFVGLNMSF